MVTPATHLFRSSLVLLIASITSCGPAFTHEALIGEDPEVHAMLGVTAADLNPAPTVVAVQRFHRTLHSRQSAMVWSLLSKDSRKVLDDLAANKLDSNGRELVSSRRFPSPAGTKGDTTMVNLVALFLVPRPTVFRAITKPLPGDTTAVVEVLNQEGKRRHVDLRKERGEWRVHQVDYSRLPALPKLTASKLPHERTDTKTKEKPEKAPETKLDKTVEPTKPPAQGSKPSSNREEEDLDF